MSSRRVATCVREKDVFEEGELLGEQLDALLQLLVLRLELADSLCRLLCLLPGLLPRPLDGLVVPGPLVEVLGVLGLLGLLARTHFGAGGVRSRMLQKRRIGALEKGKTDFLGV